MANFAQNARVRLSFVPEVTLGTTPTTPTFVEIPVVSSSLNLSKTLISSAAINSNRRKKFSRHGNVAIAGDIATELSYGQFDALLEGTLLSTWTANVLKVGVTRKSYSVEEGALDIGQYRLFKGVVPSTLAVEVAQDAIIGLTFGMVGLDMSTAQATAATTLTASTTAEPMVHKEGTISIAGQASAIVTSFSLNIDNGFTTAYVIGSGVGADISYSDATVTGSLTVYFQDLVAYNRFLTETQVSVSLVTQDPAGNKYTWLMNNCQFNTGDIPVGGQGPRTITMSFEALDDATSSPLQITRTPA